MRVKSSGRRSPCLSLFYSPLRDVPALLGPRNENFLCKHTDLTVSQLISARTQKHDLAGRLIKRRPPGDVGTWVRQVQPAALQCDVDRVGEGGVESLRVIAVRLIHPALEDNYETQSVTNHFTFSF